jgi:dTDP-4-dehydrorhamnose 3,5-epimerase-like enzyme
MAELKKLTTKVDERGSLSVIENVLPFDIKRVFFLYNIKSGEKRGGHGHIKTKMALVATGGHVDILVANGRDQDRTYHLNSASEVLILNPEDWHQLSNFSKHCSVIVMASENYDPEDYFYDKP